VFDPWRVARTIVEVTKRSDKRVLRAAPNGQRCIGRKTPMKIDLRKMTDGVVNRKFFLTVTFFCLRLNRFSILPAFTKVSF